MNRLLLVSFFLCICLTFSYGQQEKQLLKLEFFDKIPLEIDGCSGLYTYDTTLIKKEKYIIITDLQDLAFIKVQGRQIKLKFFKNIELQQSTYKAIYKGEGYTITLTTSTVKQIDTELSLENGKLEILKGTSKLSVKIHGKSGC